MPSDAFARAAATFGDNFTRANGGLGANYTTGIATGAITAIAPTITSNAIVGNTASAFQTAFYSAASFGNSQFAEITVGGAAAGTTIYMAAANSSAAQAYYFQYNGNSQYALVRNIAATSIVVVNAVPGPTLAGGNTMRIETVNTPQGVWVSGIVNGAVVVWIFDKSGTPLTGGAPGLGIFGNSATASITNFAGGTFQIGSLGSNWIFPSGTMAISSGTVSLGVGQNPNTAFALWGANLFPKDHSSQVTLVGSPGASDKVGVIVRGAGHGILNDSGSIFSGYIGYATSGTWAIAKIAAGVIGAPLTSGAVTWNSGDKIQLSAAGTNLTLLRNGASLGSIVDATYLAGLPGICVQAAGALTNWLSSAIILQTTTSVTDNFQRAGPTLGANWTGYFNNSFTIISSGVAGTTGPANDDNAPLYTGVSWPNDQWASVKINSGTMAASGAVGQGIVLRGIQDGVAPTKNDAYTYSDAPTLSVVDGNGFQNGTGNIRGFAYYIQSTTNNVLANLGGPTFQTNDQLQMAAIGDTVYAFRNGILEASARDANLTAGSAGLNSFNTWNLNSGNKTLTNFAGGLFTPFNTGGGGGGDLGPGYDFKYRF